MRLGEKADPRYTSHYFQTDSYWAQITQTARGAAQPGVNSTILKTLTIPLPPLPEQRRIADVLDRAEALRAKRLAALALLDTLTQSIFLNMFGDPVSNPKGWPTSMIGNVAEVQGGLQVNATRNVHARKVPYLRVANVYRSHLDLREIKQLPVTDSEAARLALRKNDLFLVEGHGNPSEIGRCALWDGSIQGCIHQNHIIRARLNFEVANPVYVAEYVNSPGGRRHLLSSGKTTSGLNTINVTDVRKTPLALPPLPIQQDFARRIAAVEQLRSAQRASLAKLDELFASLQHRAFRGEL